MAVGRPDRIVAIDRNLRSGRIIAEPAGREYLIEARRITGERIGTCREQDGSRQERTFCSYRSISVHDAFSDQVPFSSTQGVKRALTQHVGAAGSGVDIHHGPPTDLSLENGFGKFGHFIETHGTGQGVELVEG